jgi:hypothetical protein
MESISKIYPLLKAKVDRAIIPAHILLDKFRVIEEFSRITSAYTDPRYAPFYYYLGTLITPESFAELGYRLGFLSGCFFKACKTVKTFFAFQPKADEYYSPRLSKANTRSVFKGDFNFYYGTMTDDGFGDGFGVQSWDLIVVNEEKDYDTQRNCLDIAWENLNSGGIIVNEYVITHQPSKDAYRDFCKIQNREQMVFRTRYGTGLIQK